LAEREAAGVSGSPTLDARGAVLRAEIQLRRNRPLDALTLLDAALAKLGPESREQIGNAQFLRGDALARLNRYPEAEKAFLEEIRVFPKNSDAYARLAILYAVEHRRVRDVTKVLDAMYAANPVASTAELGAKTLESLGDGRSAAAWRRRATVR
jgi:tetratricopeptide (TPR) repeat protein